MDRELTMKFVVRVRRLWKSVPSLIHGLPHTVADAEAVLSQYDVVLTPQYGVSLIRRTSDSIETVGYFGHVTPGGEDSLYRKVRQYLRSLVIMHAPVKDPTPVVKEGVWGRIRSWFGR